MQAELTALRSKILNVLNHDPPFSALLIRFAWHVSGTWDKNRQNGGSNGATIRFAAEQNDPENAGFDKALKLYQKLHQLHKTVSYSDLYILGGYVAIEWTGGPKVPFSFGRKDITEEDALKLYAPLPHGCPFGDGEFSPHGSRLPPADLGTNLDIDPNDETIPIHIKEKPTIDAIRNTFTRMGLDDKETVALIVLGHQYGQGHADVSGYVGPWYAFDPFEWNVYTQGLGYLSLYGTLNRYREVRTDKGKRQWMMKFAGMQWMMLPADMALSWCPEYRKWIEYYDKNRVAFRKDAADAWKKLTELGCDGLLTPEHI